MIIKDNVLVVEGDASVDDYSGGAKLVARKLFSIGQAREAYARLISLTIKQDQQLAPDFGERLEALLAPNREGGECRIRIEYTVARARGRLYLGGEWRIKPCQLLLENLETLCGEKSLTVHYR